MLEFSMTELIAFVVLVVSLTIAILNAISYIVMRLTERYKDTKTKIDDRLHRKARIVLRAIEKFSEIFFARY